VNRVRVDDVDAVDLPDAAPRREVGAALGATDVALNRYTLGPGEALADTLHGHGDQEEVFVVLDGAVTFEARPLGDEETVDLTVAAGEAVRFTPGDLQRGRNASDRPATLLAIGAPPGSDDLRFPFDRLPPVPDACPDCDHDRDARLDDERFVCPGCGADLGGVND
jgi:uncharacterized cupin superfamily protein